MSDWMSDVAIEISIEQGPHGLPAIEIERRIRRHAPPQPGELSRRLKELIGFWRAASNVMSEADGDGPYRDSLRMHAKQLEELLKEVSEPPAQEKRDGSV